MNEIIERAKDVFDFVIVLDENQPIIDLQL